MARRILFVLMLCLSLTAKGQDNVLTVEAKGHDPIPIYDVSKGFHSLFRTQIDVMMGMANVYPSQKSQPSGSIGVKGIHHFTGALYVAAGGGFTFLSSESRPPEGSGIDKKRYDAYLVTLPAGLGFTMGDDKAIVITGVDLLTGYYVRTNPSPAEARRFSFGIGPEFGFMLKVGRQRQRGFYLGMTGKVQWVQSPGKEEGRGLRYGFAGAGLCARF